MEITVEHAAEAACQAKMYGRMYSELARLAEKMIEIYPALEAVRPMKSGMQALCGFHWSLDKAKSLLQYCADSSKLYLAITGDSIFSRFEKVKDGLEQNLRRLEQIVPRHLAQQIAPILTELEQTIYVRDPFEQEAGKELIALLQNSRDSPSEDVCSETSAFCEIACKLGMTSNDAILAEKKALRRLMEKAHNEEDRKKESLVSYLLRLLHRYSKIQRTDNLENETVEDGRDSFTLSLSERALEASASSGVSEGHNSEIYVEAFENESTNYKKTRSHSSLVPLPPEEFRCPISLQLMSDPVIISSGQTYERVCIEKWFEERHDTCPKTQQKLSHLGVTPNYCVKGLIASWCEKYGLTIPDPPSPLPSLVTDCRWDLQSDVGPPGDNIHLKGDPIHDKQLERHTISAHSKFSTELESLNGDGDCSVPSMYTKQSISDEDGDSCILSEGEPELDINLDDPMAGLAKLLAKLKLASLEIKCKAAERIRMLTKDNAEARSYIGDSGFIPVLVGFLQATMVAENVQAQETAALALLNIAINNNRNKAEIVAAGAVPLLVKLLASGSSLSAREAAVVVMLTISCLDENKPSIGSSGVIPYLVNHLNSGSNQGVKDALTSLFNLSIFAGNRPCIINGGVVQKLVHLLSFHDAEVTEKCISVLYNLASLEEGRASIAETEGCISALAEILDAGTHKEKELVVATFLLLCSNSVEHSQLVLREGIIPSLVKLSVTGNPRGKDKAQKLLQHFREQRQSSYMFEDSPSSEEALEIREKSRCQKIFSKKRFRKSFSFFSRSKSLGFYQC